MCRTSTSAGACGLSSPVLPASPVSPVRCASTSAAKVVLPEPLGPSIAMIRVPQGRAGRCRAMRTSSAAELAEVADEGMAPSLGVGASSGDQAGRGPVEPAWLGSAGDCRHPCDPLP